jgi:hypothetical protein
MKIFCTASSDTYINNKIVNLTRLTDSNVGRAGVLDLYKLYGETSLPTGETVSGSAADFAKDTTGDGKPDTSIELSRVLVKFNLSKLNELTGSKLDLNSENFSAKLKLFDVRTGHAVPRNFTAMAIPLSQAFDEGGGKNISSYNDIGVANFLTASYSNGSNNTWFGAGASTSGSLGSANVDLVETADFGDGSGTRSLVFNQTFIDGTEDLSLDITPYVSATLAGQIDNHGFRISLTGSEEKDEKTRFIKRFASRHVANTRIRPRIEISFDDTRIDHHQNFFFDLTGSLFLNSYARRGLTNLVSGTAGALSDITGADCLKLKLERGEFTYTTFASQHQAGTLNSGNDRYQAGVYSASFAIPSQETSLVDRDTTLAQLIARDGEVKFNQYWISNDETYAYHTGSVTIKRQNRAAGNFIGSEPLLHATNVKQQYNSQDELRVRLFGRDLYAENESAVKVPISRKSVVFEDVFYRVIDVDSNEAMFGFGENDNSTRVSTDAEGMFFDFQIDTLPQGRSYTFEYLVLDKGSREIVRDRNVIFRVL